MDKNLVVFQVYTGKKNYVRNLEHFLYFGQFPQAGVDLVVVQVGEPLSELMGLFPDVTFITTENRNLDFGAYSSVISELDTSKYSKFLFINSTVRGPYLSERDSGSWLDVFFSKISDSVQLVGSTINVLPRSSVFGSVASKVYGNKKFFPHVQSMAFALGDKGMSLLIEKGFWDLKPALSKTEIILRYELGLSQILLQAGYSIQSLVREPGIINSTSELSLPMSARNGDVHFRHAYNGRTLTPSELVFIKTNRGMIGSRKLRRASQEQLHRVDPDFKFRNRSVEKRLKKLKLI